MSKLHPFVQLYLGIVTGLVGSVAYIACLRFVSPLVVAVVMSSEPIVSGAIATVLKVSIRYVDALPNVHFPLNVSIRMAVCSCTVQRRARAFGIILKFNAKETPM
jgi:hypothetical protein